MEEAQLELANYKDKPPIILNGETFQAGLSKTSMEEAQSELANYKDKPPIILNGEKTTKKYPMHPRLFCVYLPPVFLQKEYYQLHETL